MDASVWAVLQADLAAESRELDGLLAGLEAADWERATPAEGWRSGIRSVTWPGLMMRRLPP